MSYIFLKNIQNKHETILISYLKTVFHLLVTNSKFDISKVLPFVPLLKCIPSYYFPSYLFLSFLRLLKKKNTHNFKQAR